MAVKRGTSPKLGQIIEAQAALITEITVKFYDDFDPREDCWACGRSAELERAHLIPASANGSVAPENFVMLCRDCHREQPDNASREAQLLWLRDHDARDWATFRWLNENLVKALGLRAEEYAPGQGEALIGAWMDSLGETSTERTKGMLKLFEGAYPFAGRLTREGRLNTAKYEVFAHFASWVEQRRRELLSAWAQSEAAKRPFPHLDLESLPSLLQEDQP